MIFLGFDDWPSQIWTSGNDLGEYGQHMCATTGRHISAEILKSEHINHFSHGNCMIEHCLALVRKRGNLFMFNDDVCSVLHYFLCEDRKHVEITDADLPSGSLEEVPVKKSGDGNNAFKFNT